MKKIEAFSLIKPGVTFGIFITLVQKKKQKNSTAFFLCLPLSLSLSLSLPVTNSFEATSLCSDSCDCSYVRVCDFQWRPQLLTRLHHHITTCTRTTFKTLTRPPPIEGTYVLFGANYAKDDVLPSLDEQGVRQLYPTGPNIDFKNELRSLNRDLQLHILELADVLVERPSQYARRVEDISLIFKNLHHLLNSLRPHLGRATLIHLLESQIQRRKQAEEDIKRRREEAQKLLKRRTLDGH